MDISQTPLTFFRSLKGAPAAVLCVLGFTGRAMTNQELQRWTGYGREQVAHAARLLEGLEWISAPTALGPWSLAAARALPWLAGGVDASLDAEGGPGAADGPQTAEAAPADHDARARQADALDASPESLMVLVQSLKGAPGSVLLALSATRRYMTHQELQLWTRCGHNQVTLALRSLIQLGWVSMRSSRGPWVLVTRREIPALARFNDAIASKALNDDDGLLTPPQEDPLTTSASRRQLLEAIREAGIEEPTATELASLPHVTVEYVRGHVQGARAKGLRVGAAIERMRLASPIPAAAQEGRSRREVAAEKMRRFIDGERE